MESIKFIKSLVQSQMLNVKCQMLYGGSVDSKNLGGYLQYKEIDGALVGGASLKKEEIKKMVKLATAK